MVTNLSPESKKALKMYRSMSSERDNCEKGVFEGGEWYVRDGMCQLLEGEMGRM